MAVISMLLPKKALLNIENPFVGVLCGFLGTFLQIISGVSGPVLDIFFVKNDLNRYEIIATKALTQTFGHLLKLAYYASILEASARWDFTLPYWVLPLMVASTFFGTHAGKACLKFISETQFQKITKHLIFVLGMVYLYKGFQEKDVLQMARSLWVQEVTLSEKAPDLKTEQG